MRFTNNPYEGFMKEKKLLQGCAAKACRRRAPVVTAAYWRGIGCVFCYREQLKPPGNGR